LIRLIILGTRGIPARYGGFETFAEQLATRLVTRGIDVTVACPSLSSKRDELYRGVRLKFVAFPSCGKYSEIFWDARCYCTAWKRQDVVYMLGLAGAFAAWIPRLFGKTVWVNTDGVEWKRAKFSWLQRTYLALAELMSVLFASRIIADSASIASYLRRRYPGLRKISTIAYGADIPTKEPDRKLLDEWGLRSFDYYISVCRLEPENHVLEIVEGYERSGSLLPLLILGNIQNPNPYVRRLLAKTSERIRYLGTVFDREKLEALRYHAKVYLHGHSVGGTNPSLLEAMACSNVVIAHDNPFNREVLGAAGLFFDSSEALATQIMTVESGEVDFHELRKAASDRIREHYLWDQIADQYLETLQAR
jgi:glycosyltransferase involved in cell wall biosynthesis